MHSDITHYRVIDMRELGGSKTAFFNNKNTVSSKKNKDENRNWWWILKPKANNGKMLSTRKKNILSRMAHLEEDLGLANLPQALTQGAKENLLALLNHVAAV